MQKPSRLQLHLKLPYKIEARDHPVVKRYLEQGYRIAQLQRLTDRDAIIVFALPAPAQPTPSAS
jgi:hypothetical protein